MPIRRFSFLILFLSLPVFGVAVRVAAAPVWVSPPAQQPGGNIAPPLNTSIQPQTKKGGLTIEGTVNINPGQTLTIGRSDGTSKICWNDAGDGANCRSNWSSVTLATGYLTLNTIGVPTDSGYIDLDQSGAISPQEATVTGTAGAPEAAIPTYGIQGVAVARASANTYSYGVHGAATMDQNSHYGIFATTDDGKTPLFDWSNAWAGYFDGDVAVSDIPPGTNTFDLVIGGGPAVANGVAEICLGNDFFDDVRCKSTWPTASGTGFWSLNVSTLSPKEPRSIAFAGTGSTAPFFVEVSGTGAAENANLTIRGGAKFDQYVVGTPPEDNFPVTCGDGMCTFPENDTSCPQDCDLTPPKNVLLISDPIVEEPPCHPQPCTIDQPLLKVQWLNPSDLDYAGAAVVIRTDRFPNGPNDDVFKGNIPASEQEYQEACSLGTTYYAGVYAYDLVGNIASGMLYSQNCLS